MTYHKFIIAFLLFPFLANAQSISPKVSTSFHHDVTPPLRDRKPIEPDEEKHMDWRKKHKKADSNSITETAHKIDNATSDQDTDVQNVGNSSLVTSAPVVNFDGMEEGPNSFIIPNPNGDAGPNHYFQITSYSFQVFDKTGNSLYGPADIATLFDGFIEEWVGYSGDDPIAFYDDHAERWVVTVRGAPDNWLFVAVSTSGDPLGSWYRYAIQTTDFPGAPKVGIWRDGYYVTTSAGALDAISSVIVLERDAMLNGESAQVQEFLGINPPGLLNTLLPADCDGPFPPLGTPNYIMTLVDSHWGGINLPDQLMIWECSVDWTNPVNSTITLSQELLTNEFISDLGGSINQTGDDPDLSVHTASLMYRLQYRDFGAYKTIVCNHTVRKPGTGIPSTPIQATIRWYELRMEDENTPWEIFQQRTYLPDHIHNRWLGSIAMNSNGDIALGFNIISSSLNPGIRFTGRKGDDPVGIMTIDECSIIEGEYPIENGNVGDMYWWGAYSSMTVDPVDDVSFWYTGEYYKESIWGTRIAGFNLGTECPPDLGLFEATIDIDEYDTHHVGNDLTAHEYYINGDGSDGGIVKFKAGNSILLKETFCAQAGSKFRALIEDCTIHGFQEGADQKDDLEENTEVPEKWDDSFYEHKLVVSPNPTPGPIKFSLTNIGEGEQYQVRIYNISGVLIHQSNYDYFIHSFDLSAFPTGIYTITANYKNQNWTEKILLN